MENEDLSNEDPSEETPVKLSGKVLVVDDEDALRMIVKMSAQILGLEVIEAENGHAALEIIHDDSQIDLIISDLMMPEMTGIALLRKIREEGYDTKFIIVTGYGDSKKVAEAEKLGVFAFIDKPYEIPVFEEILTKAVSKDAA